MALIVYNIRLYDLEHRSLKNITTLEDIKQNLKISSILKQYSFQYPYNFNRILSQLPPPPPPHYDLNTKNNIPVPPNKLHG